MLTATCNFHGQTQSIIMRLASLVPILSLRLPAILGWRRHAVLRLLAILTTRRLAIGSRRRWALLLLPLVSAIRRLLLAIGSSLRRLSVRGALLIVAACLRLTIRGTLIPMLLLRGLSVLPLLSILSRWSFGRGRRILGLLASRR